MTSAERLMIENQKIILHALRILLSVTKAPHHQFVTVQDQMQRIDAYLESQDQKHTILALLLEADNAATAEHEVSLLRQVIERLRA